MSSQKLKSICSSLKWKIDASCDGVGEVLAAEHHASSSHCVASKGPFEMTVQEEVCLVEMEAEIANLRRARRCPGDAHRDGRYGAARIKAIERRVERRCSSVPTLVRRRCAREQRTAADNQRRDLLATGRANTARSVSRFRRALLTIRGVSVSKRPPRSRRDSDSRTRVMARRYWLGGG